MRLSTIERTWLPNGVMRAMADIMREAGLDHVAALQAAGIAPEQLAHSAELSGPQALAFLTHFLRATPGRHDLWLRLGLRYRVIADGVFGLMVMSAPTLADATETCGWATDLNHSLSPWQPFHDGDGRMGVRQLLDDVPADLREFTMYHDAAAAAATFRDILPGDWHKITLRLPLPPGQLALVAQTCQWLRIEFGETSFHWSTEVSRTVIPHGDAVMYAHYREQCRQLRERGPAAALRDRLAEALGAHLAAPTLAAIARSLNLSPRTLQRRLDEAGLNFRSAVDQAREEAAKARLRASCEPVGQIAASLGYGNPTSFNHAFRRWTGMAPSRYRAKGARPDQPLENGRVRTPLAPVTLL